MDAWQPFTLFLGPPGPAILPFQMTTPSINTLWWAGPGGLINGVPDHPAMHADSQCPLPTRGLGEEGFLTVLWDILNKQKPLKNWMVELKYNSLLLRVPSPQHQHPQHPGNWEWMLILRLCPIPTASETGPWISVSSSPPGGSGVCLLKCEQH